MMVYGLELRADGSSFEYVVAVTGSLIIILDGNAGRRMWK